MGRIFLVELENAGKKGYYCCNQCGTAYRCRTHIALEENILSKNFIGLNQKQAYIFSTIVNEFTGYQEQGQTEDGANIMDEIYCVKCLTRLGWKYISAPGEINAFKVGKFLMDRSQLIKWRGNKLISLENTSSDSSESSESIEFSESSESD